MKWQKYFSDLTPKSQSSPESNQTETKGRRSKVEGRVALTDLKLFSVSGVRMLICLTKEESWCQTVVSPVLKPMGGWLLVWADDLRDEMFNLLSVSVLHHLP